MSDKILVKAKCRCCKKDYKLYVYPEDIERYNNGELVQDVFPYLSRDMRELLISGMCPECWDKMFSNLED